MINVSGKGRYALIALCDLAYYNNDSFTPLKHIAKRQDISLRYLEQIFVLLKKNGIVDSMKGSKGGYFLKKDPNEISVYDALLVVEPNVMVLNESLENTQNLSSIIEKNIFRKLEYDMCSYLSNITIADLIEEYAKTQSTEIMYYI